MTNDKRWAAGIALSAAVLLGCLTIEHLLWSESGDSEVRASSEPPAAKPSHYSPDDSRRPIIRRVSVDSMSALVDGSHSNPCAECGLPETISPESPPWRAWTSLDGARLASSGCSELAVFAARIPDGMSVLVVNRSAEKVDFSVDARLSRGVYTVERLVIDTKSPETGGRLERLESIVLGKSEVTSKRGWLLPGTIAVYRFVNRSADVQARFSAVKDDVRAMMGARPSECRGILVPLHECESHLGALSRGIQPGKRYYSLKFTHRALLTVSHAQALCQNYRGQGRLPREAADRLEESLDRLQAALTELSADCLNLVPSMAIATPDPERPTLRNVTVRVLNAGSEPVSLVRLGANGSAGAVVEPAERATFDTLKPGETASATFQVRGVNEERDRDLVAEVGWFVARSPAHMLLRNPM